MINLAISAAHFGLLYAAIGAAWVGALSLVGLWSLGQLILVASPVWLPLTAIASSLFLYPVEDDA